MSDAVRKRSAASQAMLDAAEKGRALMGGTRAMRLAGETYLPKFDAESPEAYEARRKASWLFNGYRKTVNDLSGRVFDKPVEAVDADDVFAGWLENVDMQGRDLSGFACSVFKDALAGAGVGFVMVEAPRRDGVVTRAEAERQNLRPYLVHLRVEDVLGWKAQTINNVMMLTQLRILEQIEEADPEDEFAAETVEQVRVLDLNEGQVNVRIFREASKGGWQQVDEYATEQTEIMVIPFYANRTGFFQAEPPLDDLADINVAHWQSQSDQRNILHFARVPVLFVKGLGEEPIDIGGSKAIATSNPDADAKWVEHSGQAIGAGRQDLKDLEFQMETFGLQLLAARAQSATGEVLDAKKETSQLAMMADGLKDALEQAMLWMGVLGNREFSGSIEVNKEFGVSMMTAQEITALLSAVNTGNLSRTTFLEEMKRRGVLRADLNVADEEERVGNDDEGLMVNVGQ